MKTRYAITHVSKSPSMRGLRVLTLANWGANHYDTREAAEAALEVLRPGLVAKVHLEGLEVRPVECYDHGDAVGTVVVDLEATCTRCKKPWPVALVAQASCGRCDKTYKVCLSCGGAAAAERSLKSHRGLFHPVKVSE